MKDRISVLKLLSLLRTNYPELYEHFFVPVEDGSAGVTYSHLDRMLIGINVDEDFDSLNQSDNFISVLRYIEDNKHMIPIWIL